jgi:hypothetical protein
MRGWNLTRAHVRECKFAVACFSFIAALNSAAVMSCTMDVGFLCNKVTMFIVVINKDCVVSVMGSDYSRILSLFPLNVRNTRIKSVCLANYQVICLV